MRYAIVIERAGEGFSGYVPDLPGCIAAGRDVAEVRAALRSVIPFHIEGLKASGCPVPAAESVLDWVEV
jgi:predicted RNase H-like HicB family nuclease